MNNNEISRIAAAISDLRPDWPAASIRSLLNRPELKNRPRRDVAVALVWVACESDSKTPARVIEAGPWWRAAALEGDITPRPPRKGEYCHTCGRYLDACLCDEPTTRPASADRQPPEQQRTQVARLRALVNAAGTEPEEGEDD